MEREGNGVLRPDDLVEVAPGVFYTANPFLLVDRAILDLLADRARTIPVRRARLCAHPSPDAAQHDMIIASHRETYVAPHRHLAKTESMLIIDGTTDLLLFDETGSLTERVAMGPAGSDRPFFYRMPAMRYHGLDIDSEVLIFAESTKGPFTPGETETAPWAPEASDAVAGCAYVAALRSRSGRQGE